MRHIKGNRNNTNLDLVVAIVVQNEDSIQLGVRCDDQIGRVLDAFSQCLPSVLLHLDVVEFSAIQQCTRRLFDAFTDRETDGGV